MQGVPAVRGMQGVVSATASTLCPESALSHRRGPLILIAAPLIIMNNNNPSDFVKSSLSPRAVLEPVPVEFFRLHLLVNRMLYDGLRAILFRVPAKTLCYVYMFELGCFSACDLRPSGIFLRDWLPLVCVSVHLLLERILAL